MTDGDIFQVGRRHGLYLVAPINQQMLEALIIAMGSTENDEENGDERESSLGDHPRELEGDGLEDGYGGLPRGHECALVTEPLDQSVMACSADEHEPELGWANTGPQLRLSEGYSGGNLREGDGDCDAEDHDPGGDAMDQGELDLCDDEPDGPADLFTASFAGSPLALTSPKQLQR